jgi:hypothetical protein
MYVHTVISWRLISSYRTVAIETGALTSIVAVLNIIAFVVSKVSRITLGV